MKEKCGVHFISVVTEMVELKKCSRSYHSYKNHIHQELSIGIIREGSTKVKFPGITIEFRKGDGVIIPPRLSHMCSPEDVEHWCFDMLYVDPAFYGEELAFETAKKVSDATSIEEFLAIQKESANQEYVEEYLIELLEELSEDNDKDNIIEEDEVDNLKLYIENHWLDKIRLEELEIKFRMSKFSMIRNFRKKYNTTPMAYQLQLKIAEAKKLLMQQVPILDVCYELGFYDQAHFTREFHKTNGLSPSMYQKNINE